SEPRPPPQEVMRTPSNTDSNTDSITDSDTDSDTIERTVPSRVQPRARSGRTGFEEAGSERADVRETGRSRGLPAGRGRVRATVQALPPRSCEGSGRSAPDCRRTRTCPALRPPRPRRPGPPRVRDPRVDGTAEQAGGLAGEGPNRPARRR